ncbi:MAG: RNA polymerase sigma factor [Acidobacteria bacterium]|nr:RNA polymerase sigma factor [Acidobacteriota bacterium]
MSAEIQRLIQEHWRQIEVAAKRVLGQHYPQAMDELRQEVSISIWRMLERGDEIRQWEAFIYNCAHKRALDLLKQSRRRARREVSFSELSKEGEAVGEEQLAEFVTNFDLPTEGSTLVEQELAKLPSAVALTVLLRVAEGYSRAEVARILHCSTATVDYRLRRGLQQLRKRLKQHERREPTMTK